MTIKGYVVRGQRSGQTWWSIDRNTLVLDRDEATEYPTIADAVGAMSNMQGSSAVTILRVHDDGRQEALPSYEEALARLESGTLETRASIAGGNDETITAVHRIEQTGEQVTVSELWTDAAGAEVSAYRVTLPLATLVHVALNTTAEERAAIDLRADWRGVPQSAVSPVPFQGILHRADCHVATGDKCSCDWTARMGQSHREHLDYPHDYPAALDRPASPAEIRAATEQHVRRDNPQPAILSNPPGPEMAVTDGSDDPEDPRNINRWSPP